MNLLRCEEKVRLLIAYQDAAAIYSAAVGEMARFHISADLLERLRDAAEKTRKASEAARTELEQHIAQHRC